MKRNCFKGCFCAKGIFVGQALPDNAPAKGHLAAFTLIELLVVVLIIGILASVAVPQYQVAVKKAKLMKYVPIVRTLNQAEQAYYLANGKYTAVLANLDVDIPSEGCTYYQTVNSGYYVCGPDNKERYGVWGGISNAQAGDDSIRYLQYFAAYDAYDIQAGDTACYSRGDIARRACRSLGNGTEKEASATGWDYIYVIPS